MPLGVVQSQPCHTANKPLSPNRSSLDGLSVLHDSKQREHSGLWELAIIGRYPHTCRDCHKRDSWRRNGIQAGGLVYSRETKMPQSNHEPSTAETGKQVPVRPHDSGSAANETVDGLDATTEALRHAAEDTPAGAAPDDVEKVPVFDRAGQAPKI
jgi:hypothetical protein